MSKWIYSTQQKCFWNLDKVNRIILKHDAIELIYDDEGSNEVNFETMEEMMECWRLLKDGLLR